MRIENITSRGKREQQVEILSEEEIKAMDALLGCEDELECLKDELTIMSSDEAKSELANSRNQLRQLKYTMQCQQLTPAEEQFINHLKTITREIETEEEQAKTEIKNQNEKRKKLVRELSIAQGQTGVASEEDIIGE
eukprot:7197521-Ditylum_brightwellii.AAC.1